jgi:carboxy-terminal domain RNA polymerase II polypeptide A small phosphatase
LDLDETLVHSSFVQTHTADFIVKIDDEHGKCQIFVKFRPGAKKFIEAMSKIYEVVIFTASMSSYASPVIDALDEAGYEFYKLFREHCKYSKETNLYIKDLSRLGRDPKDMIIIDNIPQSYCL